MTKETREWVKAALDLCKKADSAESVVLFIHPMEDKAGQVTLFGDIVVTNETDPDILAQLVRAIQQPVPQSTQE